jgi:hypothetical protein
MASKQGSDMALGLRGDMNPDELQKALNKLIGTTQCVNLIEQTELQQYWKCAMDALLISVKNIATELTIANNAESPYQSQEQINERISFFEKNVADTLWCNDDMRMSPTEFYYKFFAKCVKINAVQDGKYNNWRLLFEHISAVSQCDAAKKKIQEIISWDICYICGHEILDRDASSGQKTRECEHVLPAFTSLGYKGLIQSAKTDNLDPSYLTFFKYEYVNAHHCCNQIKSDEKWIMYAGGNDGFVIDNNNLTNTLKRIWSSNTYDCKAVKKEYSNTYNTPQQFIDARSTFISTTFLNPLLTIINNTKNDYGNLFDLKIRINQISALKINCTGFAHAILNSTQPPEPVTAMLTVKEAIKLFGEQTNASAVLICFSNVFNNIFSNIDDHDSMRIFFNIPITQRFSTRTPLPHSIFRYSEEINKISAVTIAESETDLKKLYITTTHNAEELVTTFINKEIISLSTVYSSIIYKILEDVLKTIADGENKNTIMRLLSAGFEVEQTDENKKNEEQNVIHQIAISTPPSITLVDNTDTAPQVGGSIHYKNKNKNNNNAMTGGNVNLLIESLKFDIINLAMQNGINPTHYGINIQTTITRSGRISKPPTIFFPGGFSINGYNFTNNPDGSGVSAPNGAIIPYVTQGQRKGINIDGQFYQVGGYKTKHHKTKHHKTKHHKTKRHKTKHHKTKHHKTK